MTTTTAGALTIEDVGRIVLGIPQIAGWANRLLLTSVEQSPTKTRLMFRWNDDPSPSNTARGQFAIGVYVDPETPIDVIAITPHWEDAMNALDPYYQDARDFARELITLIKVAEEHGTDPDGHVIRGQVRQAVNGNTPARTWLLIEVLARAVAATYDDLADWSASVIEALADEETP